MRFGFWSSAGHTWEQILEGCRHAEQTGWDGIWIPDHFMPPPGGHPDDPVTEHDPELGATHEAWTLIAGLAAATSRVRLGTLVTGNTYRHPAVLANMAATADHISGGRLVLGLGAAWRENEHRAYGIEFPSFRDRLARLEEACAVISGLFSNVRTDYQGRYYHLNNAPLEPKPIQRNLPLMIGGGGGVMSVAARWADEWNDWATPEGFSEKSAQLDRHCLEAGRDPAQIQRSAVALLFLCEDEAAARRLRDNPPARPSLIGTVDQLRDPIAAYAEAGADELIVPDFTLPLERRLETLDQFIEEVAADFR